MIGRKALTLIISKLISAALGFICLFFISRYLGPGVYGTITWTMAALTSVNFIVDLGFTNAHVKRLSEGKDLNECISTYAFVRVVLTMLMAASLSIGIIIYTYSLGLPLVDTSLEVFFILLAYYVIYDIAGIAIYTFDGKMETSLSQLALLADIAVRVPLVAFVSLNMMGAEQLAMTYLVGAIAMFAVSFYFLGRKRIRLTRPTLFKSYLEFAMPGLVYLILTAIVANADRIFVGYFLSDVQMGYYAGAQSILLMIASIGGGATILFFPAFSNLHHKGNLKEVTRITWQAERYLSFLCVPLLLVIIVFPDEFVKVLLGPRFDGSDDVIPLLAISTMLILVNQPYSVQLFSANKPKIGSFIVLVQMITYIPLLVLLVPSSILGYQLLDQGILGAGLANLISTIVFVFVGRGVVSRITGVRSNNRILVHFITGGFICLVFAMFSGFFTIENWYSLLLITLSSYAMFLGILYFLGQLTKDDARYVIDMVNPIELKRYILNEIKGKP